MATISEIYQKMTLTGFIIFLLGIVTLTPEIYFSGIIVMALSVAVELKDVEKMAQGTQGVPDNHSHPPTYGSW